MVYHPVGSGSADAYWTFKVHTSQRPQTAQQFAANLADVLRQNGATVHSVGSLRWSDGVDRAFVSYDLKARGALVRERAVIATIAARRLFVATESAPPTKWSEMEDPLEAITRSVQFEGTD